MEEILHELPEETSLLTSDQCVMDSQREGRAYRDRCENMSETRLGVHGDEYKSLATVSAQLTIGACKRFDSRKLSTPKRNQTFLYCRC